MSARQSDRMIEMWVDDEGPGLLPFEREKVFQPFQGPERPRQSGRHSSSGGLSTSSGIGRAICQAIVEAHGGTIRAEESPGGGARFAFRLPVHRG